MDLKQELHDGLICIIAKDAYPPLTFPVAYMSVVSHLGRLYTIIAEHDYDVEGCNRLHAEPGVLAKNTDGSYQVGPVIHIIPLSQFEGNTRLPLEHAKASVDEWNKRVDKYPYLIPNDEAFELMASLALGDNITSK